MPGVSSTIATRWPTRRLNRVDLPTLGLPTTATRGRDIRSDSISVVPPGSALWRQSKLEGGQTGAVFAPRKVKGCDLCLLHGVFFWNVMGYMDVQISGRCDMFPLHCTTRRCWEIG